MINLTKRLFKYVSKLYNYKYHFLFSPKWLLISELSFFSSSSSLSSFNLAVFSSSNSVYKCWIYVLLLNLEISLLGIAEYLLDLDTLLIVSSLSGSWLLISKRSSTLSFISSYALDWSSFTYSLSSLSTRKILLTFSRSFSLSFSTASNIFYLLKLEAWVLFKLF